MESAALFMRAGRASEARAQENFFVMSMTNIKDQYTVQQAITPRQISSSATITGATIDFANQIENMIEVQPGTWTDGVHTPTLQDSPDNITFTNVTAANQIGTLVPIIAAGSLVQKVGYVGAQRYVRLQIVSTGVTTGMGIAAAALTRPRKMPAP